MKERGQLAASFHYLMDLVEYLLCNGRNPLELTERAGAGLADVLSSARAFMQ